MKHTPTPWHVVNGTQIRDELMPFDKDESCTALIATAGSEHDSEFIVRACNSHDQLVASLKEMTEEFEGAIPDHRNADMYEVYNRAIAALAAAGEQS